MIPYTNYLHVLLFLLLTTAMVYSQEQFVVLDGKKIWTHSIGLEDRKAGEPLIVLQSGLGTPLGHWDTILEEVAKLGPVFAYDRPGVGKSEPNGKMPNIQNVSTQLVALLQQQGLAPPYLLVGHSLGGVYVRGFAVYYPEMLSGLVIIDPGDFTETKTNKRDYFEVFGWDDDKIDAILAAQQEKRTNRKSSAPLSIQAESKVLEDLRATDFKEITNHKLPNIPVHILTGGRFDYPKHLHSKDYDEEQFFRSKMRHRVARWTDVIQSVDKGMLFYSASAGHFVHRDDPELVIASIRIALLEGKF